MSDHERTGRLPAGKQLVGILLAADKRPTEGIRPAVGSLPVDSQHLSRTAERRAEELQGQATSNSVEEMEKIHASVTA